MLRRLGLALVLPVLGTGLCAVPVVAEAFTHPAPAATATAAPTIPAQLITKHDCWTGQAPADMEGKLPGHVVVSIGDRTVYAGPHRVAQALDQIFNGHNHDLTVVGFCR